MTRDHPLARRIMCHNCPVSNCVHCERPARARGLCNAHYKKLLKFGDPLAGRTTTRGLNLTRLEAYLFYVQRLGPDDCWPWTGGRDIKNYGTFANGKGGADKAHRAGFSMQVHELEPGEVVDHTCHNRDPDCPGGNTCEHRACQNPSHWEAVSDWENGSRGQSFSAVNARKKFCKWGHELTLGNSYGYKGRRQCKTCARLAARGQHPRQLAAQH